MRKGISLIVLIITIIVMIIIAGAIIISLSNTNIIKQAEEATFKTKIRGIQDALLLKKASIWADTGNATNEYNITMSDLGLDKEIVNSYSSKLFVDSSTGELKYIEDSVTADEEKWLKELGINGSQDGGNNARPTTLLAALQQSSNSNKKIYGNVNDYYGIIEDVKDDYENLVVLVEYNGAVIKAKNSNTLVSRYYYMLHCENETLEYLKVTYTNPSSVVLTQEIKNDLKVKLGGELNIDNINSFFNECTTVADLISRLEQHITSCIELQIEYICVSGDEKVLISAEKIENYVQNEDYYILSGSELSKFTYTEVYDGVDEMENVAIITRYNDDENNIIVPGYIVKDNGDVLLVKEIASNAFATTKPTRLDATTSLFDLFTKSAGKTYNDIDVATLKIILETYLTKTIDGTYADTKEGKNQMMLEHLIPDFLGEGMSVNDVAVVEGTGENQKIYVVANVDVATGMPTMYNKNTEYVERREKIVISENIKILGDNIISGNYIDVIQIPTYLKEVSPTAFANARLLKIRGRLDYYELRSKLSSSFDGHEIFGSKCTESEYEQITD